MIDWTDIPRIINYNGDYVKDLGEAEAFEFLVAQVLKARVAAAGTEDYDVYGSALFPGLTFQIKFANPREHEEEIKIVGERLSTWRQSPTWTWREARALGADWYLLFGRLGNIVYPFACPDYLWESESYDAGNSGRLLTISTDEFSSCGRYPSSYKRNKFWPYVLRRWPDDLFERIAYYQEHQPREQLTFDLAELDAA